MSAQFSDDLYLLGWPLSQGRWVTDLPDENHIHTLVFPKSTASINVAWINFDKKTHKYIKYYTVKLRYLELGGTKKKLKDIRGFLISKLMKFSKHAYTHVNIVTSVIVIHSV